MKKRTLNQTWILCLRMWRWIAANWIDVDTVDILKRQWLLANGFERLEHDCFFCEYSLNKNNCVGCPGRLVASNFHCNTLKYDYETKPVVFYKELLRLNRIRKGKK